ncbi:MAG: hypothetical protein Q4C61_11970 [Lachnospiraceae bacterium]|nr:hypothetical protein [Lachnospiraceae bacterium]
MLWAFGNKKNSRTKFIWLTVFLFFVELAVISGRTDVTVFLPHDAEGQAAHVVTMGKSPEAPAAVLSSVSGGAENILCAASREQRILTRAVPRVHVFVCGLFLLCLHQILRQMLYIVSDGKSYRRSNYILTYIYNIVYL